MTSFSRRHGYSGQAAPISSALIDGEAPLDLLHGFSKTRGASSEFAGTQEHSVRPRKQKGSEHLP